MVPHLNSQLRFFLAQLSMCLFIWVIEVWLSSVVAFLQRLNDLRCSSVYSDNHGNHGMISGTLCPCLIGLVNILIGLKLPDT